MILDTKFENESIAISSAPRSTSGTGHMCLQQQLKIRCRKKEREEKKGRCKAFYFTCKRTIQAIAKLLVLHINRKKKKTL